MRQNWICCHEQKTRRVFPSNSCRLRFFSLLQIRRLVRFRQRFLRVRLPSGRVGGRGRVDAKVPHIEVHSFFAQHFGNGVFARCEGFGGGELNPASGHGGHCSRDIAFVGFGLSGNRDLDSASNAFAALDLDANDLETVVCGGPERRRLARQSRGAAPSGVVVDRECHRGLDRGCRRVQRHQSRVIARRKRVGQTAESHPQVRDGVVYV